MRSNKGITIASLLVYIIAMTIVIGTVATIASSFYKNVDQSQEQINSSYSYIKFTKYIVNEINKTGNYVGASGSNYIVFSKSNNRYEYNAQSKAIYLNDNIKICDDIVLCEFGYDNDTKTLSVRIKTSENKEYTNEYHIVDI